MVSYLVVSMLCEFLFYVYGVVMVGSVVVGSVGVYFFGFFGVGV